MLVTQRYLTVPFPQPSFCISSLLLQDTHVMSIDDVTFHSLVFNMSAGPLSAKELILDLQKIPLISFLLRRNVSYCILFLIVLDNSISETRANLTLYFYSTPPPPPSPPSRALSHMKIRKTAFLNTIYTTSLLLTQHILPIIAYQTLFFLFSKSTKFLPINSAYHSSTMKLCSLFASHVSSCETKFADSDSL